MILLFLLLLIQSILASSGSSTASTFTPPEIRSFNAHNGITLRQWLKSNKEVIGLPVHMKLLLLDLETSFPELKSVVAEMETFYSVFQLKCVNSTFEY